MQKLKTQKGITLIALIITIIVMLILVGVSVTVALDGGLFNTAQQAAGQTTRAKEKELLQSVAIGALGTGGKVDFTKLDANLPDGITRTNGELVYKTESGNEFLIRENGGILDTDEYVLEAKYGLKIGDKVDYNETVTKNGQAVTGLTANMEWRVLGVNDKGQVELISTMPTTETVNVPGTMEAYLNVETTLNNACSVYGQGKGAITARSLTAEDIHELGNSNPKSNALYGKKYTYKYHEGRIYAIESSKLPENDLTKWSGIPKEVFYAPEWTIDSNNIGPKELKNTAVYDGTLSSIIKTSTPDNISMADILSNGLTSEKYVYWLATKVIYADTSYAQYNVSLIVKMGDTTQLYSPNFVNSYSEDNSGADYPVRPVVVLESDVEFTYNSTIGMYEI